MHRIVGLDWSSDSLRVVALESGFRGFTVLEARAAPLPPEGAPGEKLKTALAMLEMASGDDVVALALPAAQVACHLFTLPFTDPRRIEQVLPAEVEGAIPFDLEEVVWDHAVLSQTEEKSVVAVAVAKKALVREHLAALKEAGLEPKVVTFAPMALGALSERKLVQGLPAEGSAESVLLLEGGPDRAHFSLVVGNSVALLRSLSLGGPAQFAAAALGDEGLRKLLLPLVRDLKLSLRARTGAGAGVAPVRILLAGSLAALPGAAALLSEELGAPAAPVEFTAEANLPAGSIDPATAALALALSLRAQQPRGKINFRKGEFAFTKDLSQVKGQIGWMAAAAGLLLVLGLGLGVAQVTTLGRRAKDYDDALCAATKKVLGNCVTDYKLAVAQMSGTTSKAAGIPRTSATDVFAEVLAHLPEASLPLLEDVEITTSSVRLKGVAESYQQVDQIKDGLKTDKCFGEIKPPRTEKLRDSQKFSFTMDFPYACSGETGGS
jgi:Tfp pilus assembly PilM family ATPase